VATIGEYEEVEDEEKKKDPKYGIPFYWFETCRAVQALCSSWLEESKQETDRVC